MPLTSSVQSLKQNQRRHGVGVKSMLRYVDVPMLISVHFPILIYVDTC